MWVKKKYCQQSPKALLSSIQQRHICFKSQMWCKRVHFTNHNHITSRDIIPVNVQRTGKLVLYNSGMEWKRKKKKEFFLMQLKLEEHGDSNRNLAPRSCLQSSKFTKLAMFSGSEGLKPNQCCLTTWSHVYHAGLAPSQTKGSGL